MKRNITHDLFGAVVKPDSINSKEKGDSNEREFAKYLKEWTGVPFCRVPRSGGLRWKNTANVCGDVVCEDMDFKFRFAVETKSYKTITFSKVIGKNNILLKFWRQAREDAERAEKEPMLSVRANGMPKSTWVIYFNFELPEMCFTSEGLVDDEKIYGYSSEDILNTLTYKELIEYLQEHE